MRGLNPALKHPQFLCEVERKIGSLTNTNSVRGLSAVISGLLNEGGQSSDLQYYRFGKPEVELTDAFEITRAEHNQPS